MDVARLVLDYLQVITWPLLVPVGVLLFRKQLAVLIGRIKKLSFGGFDIELDVRARRVGTVSEAIPELVAADSLLNAIRNLAGALTHISTHFGNQ